MGAALETLSGYSTQATTTAGTYFALTPQSGQSFTIRSTPTPQAGFLLSPWAEFGAAGYLQVKSPRMHDTTIGTTFAASLGTQDNALKLLGGFEYQEPAWNTDVLTVQATTIASQGSSTAYLGAFNVYYPSLPGVSANFATWAQVQSYANFPSNIGDHYVSWVRPSTSGTAGALGTGVAINSTNDQFKANHSYALLGYLCPVQVGLVVLQGVDTGNIYVGGPGVTDPDETRDYFVRLSAGQGIASIPIIQANNKGATFIYVADAQTTSTAETVGLIWMDLGVLGTPIGQ